MPLIDYPDVAELDAQTRGMLEEMPSDEIPSFPLMLANNPAILEATSGQFFEVIYGGELESDVKQLAFVVVSQENESPYCAATHGSELVNDFGLSETHLAAIAEGNYTEFTDQQRAVAEFARQAAADPKRITNGHVEALEGAGFDDADVIELTAVVGQAAFANTIADAMDIVPSHQSPELQHYYPKEMSVHE